MAQQILAVFGVLVLLICTLWFLRRKGLASLSMSVPRMRSSQKRMQVLERIPLTPHHSLHLVKVNDRVILIGVSPSGCNHIDALPPTLSGTEVSERV